MKIEFLISTMNQKDLSFLDSIFQNFEKNSFNAFIVNQCTNIEPKEIKTPDNIKIISLKDRGLSKSRNLLLRNTDADICVLCDDDLVYHQNCINKIIKSYNDYPDAGIITFKASNPDGLDLSYSYPKKITKHTFATAFRIKSFEITFRPEIVRKAGICFDEKFGLGTRFISCEETAFLFDSIKAGIKSYFIPEPIVTHPDISSGIDYSNHNLVLAKGAALARLFGPYKSIPIYFAFAFKQRKYYNKYYKYKEFMKFLFEGRRYFLS